jgi:ATP-dependent helicase/nuclease subunit B
MPLQKIHLDWKRPLLDELTELLLGEYSGGLLDLRDTLIIVPTTNAGRRLRERLARAVGKQGGAVLPGMVITPHGMLSGYIGPELIAGRVETVAAWIATLRRVRSGDFPVLFPLVGVDKPAEENKLRRITSTAEKFRKLRVDLGEQGLSIQALAARDDWNSEPERWRELAGLEQLYLDQLSRRGKIDLSSAQQLVAEQPVLPECVNRVLLLAVPDPLPMALKVLDIWSQKIPVEVIIHAPQEIQERFDRWGRPLPASWEEAEIPLQRVNVRLADKPAAQAAQLLQIPPGFAPGIVTGSIEKVKLPVDDLAVGVLNPEVVPFLEQELQDAGTASWNPAGVLCVQHHLTRLLSGFCELMQDDSYTAFSRLVRRHSLLAMLEQKGGFSIDRMLTQLDQVQNYYLPATFSRLVECAGDYHQGVKNETRATDLMLVIDMLTPLLKQAGKSLTGGLRAFLQLVLSGQRLKSDRPDDRVLLLVAEQLAGLLSSFEQLQESNYQLTGGEQIQLLLQELRTLKYHPERPPVSVELEGWLELHWNDAPCLLLSGMNDGFVPEAVVGDLFLPDSAREQLGLKNNRSRFARDAYLLSAIAASRTGDDSGLQIVVGKNSSRGDPLRPSRLLFQCSPAQLPGRVRELFGAAPRSTGTTRSSSWQLHPALRQHGDTISVTDFRRYLSCPFRFYLARVLRMKSVDDRVQELTAARFGQLCHRALEQFGRSELRDSTDDQEIAYALLKRADALIHGTFGQELSTALMIQHETLRQRLRRAAKVQAQLRQDGWRIIDVEREFRNENTFELAGIRISGTIDRVDRHENGRYRLLDYKTGGRELQPDKNHLGKPDDETRGYNILNGGKKPRAWIDLQLPLYHAMLSQQLQGVIEVGYFALPSTGAEAGIYPWELTEEMTTSALECARGVIDDIRAGRFWPPAARPGYDEFADLFSGTPEKQVAAEAARWLQGRADAEEVE